MSKILQYTMIDGIRCFSPEAANTYYDYPNSGFDLTDKTEESSFWVRSRNRLFKWIVYSSMVPMGKTKLLEIGCGTGTFIRQIANNENLQITGSEIYLKGLLYAQKNLPGVDFIQFDIAQGRISEQFDIITVFDVIEHIENDVAAISNINQMLHENGILIVSVPQYMFLWSRLDEIVRHKRRYSRHELIGKLKKNGFYIDYCTSFVFVLFPLMLVSRLFGIKRDQSQSEDTAFDKLVRFPNTLNWFFDIFMRIDEVLIRAGLSLPFGGTLLVLARKV